MFERLYYDSVVFMDVSQKKKSVIATVAWCFVYTSEFSHDFDRGIICSCYSGRYFFSPNSWNISLYFTEQRAQRSACGSVWAVNMTPKHTTMKVTSKNSSSEDKSTFLIPNSGGSEQNLMWLQVFTPPEWLALQLLASYSESANKNMLR